MSKNLTNKPLKGTSVSANSGVFDTLEANKIILPAETIDGLVNGTQLAGVTIIDSQIINTIIGADAPNEGHFTVLTSQGDITFRSIDGTKSAAWDSINGIFGINGEFYVTGCSTLGNLGICVNTIRALNTNGDINLVTKGFGTLYFTGPVSNVVNSTGNYLTSLAKGNVTFISSDYISLTSKSAGSTITSFSDQVLSTVNGDITLNTETGLGNNFITNIYTTSGNTVITTNNSSKVRVGDVVNLSNTNSVPSVDGTFTVTSIVNSNAFVISTGNTFAGITTIGTSGTLYKPATNNINLNAAVYVKIPENIKLTFGSTSNSVVGNSGGLFVNSQSDVKFNISSSNSLIIPQTTKFQLGTSGNNYINFDGTSMNMNSYSKVNLNGTDSYINTPNTFLTDSNPMISNYTQSFTDISDRGIQYNYYEGNLTSGTAKLGWFGWKKSTGKFTFLKDAVNNGKVFSGTLGEFELGAVTAGSITLVTGGNTINLNCGYLLNVNTITGCGNILNINAANTVNITTSSRIALQSAGDIYIPNNIPLTFGTSGTYIKEGTIGNIWLTGSKNIMLNTQTIGSVIIQPNVKVSFDGTSVGNQSISSDTNGNLNLNTNKNINLLTTAGNIIIPQNTSGSAAGYPSIQFGGTFLTSTTTATETISGSTKGIFIISNSSVGTVNSIATSSVNISSSLGNVLVNTFNGDIQLYATSGNITTGGSVRLYQGSRVVFGISGTSNSIRSNSSGNLMINGPNVLPSTGTIGNLIELKNAAVINLNAANTVNIPTAVQFNLDNTSTRFIIADTQNNFNITNSSTGNINITTLNTNINNTGGTTTIQNNTTTIVGTNTNITSQSVIITGTTGSTTLINTQDTKFFDPILTLANYTQLSNDGKDRGIEYRYTNTSGSNKLGWFGYKNSTGQFTYYSDAINTNEVITGTLGQFALGSVVIDGNLAFLNTGNINMNCGTISNMNTILGCGGTVNVIGSTNINLSAANINLVSNTTGRVLIPTAVPLSFGSTSNNINTDSNGNITITSNNGIGTLILNANVQINGTTENVYSTVTNVQDPVFSLGGVTGPVVDDLKDRGIEFKWYGTRNGVTGTKVGFFGFHNPTQRFTYFPVATNANEIITGTPGDVEFTNGYFKNLDVSCGTVSNVAVITACAGQGLSLVSSSGNINISSSNIIVPNDTKLGFGTTSNSISADTSGNLKITSINNTTVTSNSGGIIFNTNTSGSGFTQFSMNSPMYFGNQTSGNFLQRDTAGNFIIANTSGDIYLSPAKNAASSNYGSVILPVNDKLVFGDPRTRIESDTSGNLNIFGWSIGINSTSNIIFNGNVDIAGSFTSIDAGTYIYPLGTKQQVSITNIINSPTTGNILITTSLPHYLVVNDKIKLANTNSIPSTNGDYTVNQIIDSYTFSVASGSLTTPGSKGTMYGVLKVYQGKDVGIEVDYWSTVGNTSVTAGSANFKTAFFGWLNNTQEWTYYSSATIDNSIVTQGILGNLRANKLFTNNISGFILDGAITAGSNAVIGSNFKISGGTIDGTPVGQTTAQAGRFTSLASTSSTTLRNVTMQSNMNYSVERYTLTSLNANRSPDTNVIITYVSVSGASFTGNGNMNTSGLTDGQVKKIVCSSMGIGCEYVLNFASGTLITPNPLGAASPTKLTFRRSGQSCELTWDGTILAWVITGGTGAYAS